MGKLYDFGDLMPSCLIMRAMYFGEFNGMDLKRLASTRIDMTTFALAVLSVVGFWKER